MPSFLSNPWNNAVSFVETFAGPTLLGSGTCFFWQVGDKTFLVTNWHNLAGRNPLTGEVLSATSRTPDCIAFRAYKSMSAPDAHGFVELRFDSIKIGLLADSHRPRWLEHPLLGRKVDIAVLEVTTDVQGYNVAHANAIEDDAVLHPFASQDVFVVGFPFGLIANAPAPLWKRGTIALDPTFDADGLPKMLIDTATRPGMSGSVVIARHIIVGKQYPRKDGTQSAPVLYARKDCVIGIYSGRHYPDFDKAQLGIVWKRSAIEETIAGGVCASTA